MIGTRQLAALSLVLAGTLPATLPAQQGPIAQVSYASKLEATGIGAGFGFSLGEPTDKYNLWGQTTVDYFFVDKFTVPGTGPVQTLSRSYWEFNLNLLKVVPAVSGLYVGGGFNYATDRIDGGNYAGDAGGANMGVSVLGGLHFGPLNQAPFIQARYEFGGGKLFVLSAGLAF